MKKNTIHQFGNDIFPRDLFILITDDIKGIQDSFELIGVDIDRDWLDNCAAFVASCIYRETGKLGILTVFRSKKQMSIKNMAHEALHVATAIHKDCGMAMGFDSGQDETCAYLAGWAADCFNQVRTNKFR